MRNLVLGIGATLAVVAAGWLALGRGSAGEVDAVRSEAHDTAGPDPAARAPRPALESVLEAGRTSATLPEPAGLDVRVVDQEGGPLEEARIILTAGAQRLEQRGSRCTFDGLTSDAGVLRVEHERFPAWERALAFTPGSRGRQVVQLRLALDLRGRVVDRFGTPLAGKHLWFLRDGQRHPMDADAARRLLSAVGDREGRVRVTLPEAGEWRLSLGRVAEPEMADEPRTFVHGGQNTFEVVLYGTTRLEVRVDYPGAPEPLTAIVLARTEDMRAARDERKDESDPTREKRLEEALARGALDPTRLGSAVADPAPREPQEWVNRQSRRVANDGRVVFSNLRAGEELRIAIVRPGERYESNTSISLTPDQRAVVEVTVPAEGTGAEDVVMPLPLRWRSESLAADDHPVGVRWRN